MDKDQKSEIKSGPDFHGAVKRDCTSFIVQERREVTRCLCEKVRTGTLLWRKDEAPVWNKFEDECGAGMGKEERPSL